MEIQEIKGEDYSIHYEPESTTVHFQGELSLGGTPEYAPISQMLEMVADQNPTQLILNLSNLKFLNSSGISMLSKFVINLRKKQTIQVIVIGSNNIPWQGKSLKNLEKLFPGLKLEFL